MENKYAYVTLLYPNKNGECTYLDGALLMALSLRKQCVKYKIICMITPDVNVHTQDILKIVFDEIIVVEYISPVSNKGLTISGELFSDTDYKNDSCYNNICHVFTKLHIFDPEQLPYDKLVFVDTDIIALKNYDKLFDLDTPAGWLEQILELLTDVPVGYTRTWGEWENIKHGQTVPKLLTDIYKKPGSCVNAGLLVISPDKTVYNHFISELKRPMNEWFGDNFIHKGSIDLRGVRVNHYPYPEQCYLTQHFSGQWKMIDGKYAAWGKHTDNEIYGMHMAGLKYIINGTWKEYKTWMVQITINDGFNDITNIVALWALENFPILNKYIMKNLHVYCNNTLTKFNKIKKESDVYNNMLDSQKKLHERLLN